VLHHRQLVREPLLAVLAVVHVAAGMLHLKICKKWRL
jgi:hypothetical protein